MSCSGVYGLGGFRVWGCGVLELGAKELWAQDFGFRGVISAIVVQKFRVLGCVLHFHLTSIFRRLREGFESVTQPTVPYDITNLGLSIEGSKRSKVLGLEGRNLKNKDESGYHGSETKKLETPRPNFSKPRAPMEPHHIPSIV